MKLHVLGFALWSAIAIVASAPAQAQNGSLTRSFVSSAGIDTNACTITAPCASFAHAYTAIGANGIIAALDPGKYGPITITGPVTINGNGWSAITGTAQGNGITITAGSGNVILKGLEIDGAGAAYTGIDFTGGGTLTIDDSAIANFSTAGIVFNPTAASQLFVWNTTFSDDGDYAIDISSAQSGANVTGSIDHVHESSSGSGLTAATVSGDATINVTISDSLFANNLYQGIQCLGDGAVVNQVQCLIRNTTTANNENIGIFAYKSTIWVTRSSIFGNATGLSFGSGSLISYGDNNQINNTTPGSFSSMLTYQ
jgi:hypothetical protein